MRLLRSITVAGPVAGEWRSRVSWSSFSSLYAVALGGGVIYVSISFHLSYPIVRTTQPLKKKSLETLWKTYLSKI